VVASRDEVDPDHPIAVAREYVARIPDVRMTVEDPGESPLAWRGGRLSEAIVDLLEEVGA
jgi:hypothetical protein